MHKSILEKIKLLGGNIDKVKGKSLTEDLLSIEFNTVLYLKKEDEAWKTPDAEPIYGLGNFIDKNLQIYDKNPQDLFDKIIDKYFRLTQESFGQSEWIGKLFTPFKEGTIDFTEWNADFASGEDIDLKEIIKLSKNRKPDLVHVFYCSGSFPDQFYICSSDSNPDNPTLFSTDHELFFSEVTNEGNLEDYLNNFLTKDELIEIVKKRF
jgi:hypothetical protein